MNDTVIAFLSSSVLELHQNPAVEAPQKKINTKFDHLVLGPAAGQGLPNRLQCQAGTKALNKTHTPSSSNAGESVAFVTVFTVYNTSLADSRLSNMVTVGNASYTKMERSMAVLNVFINFIQVTMPRSNVVILTDPASDLSLSRNSVTVYPIQGDYSRDKLMLQRIKSYITFLETRLGELALNPGHTSHYIFTDSDIAVVDDLGHLFNDHPNFHLALTFRNNKEQPLNSGFIADKQLDLEYFLLWPLFLKHQPWPATTKWLLRAGLVWEGLEFHAFPYSFLATIKCKLIRRDSCYCKYLQHRAKIFLQEVLKVYSSKYMSASRMLGDQLALAWAVKSHPGFDMRRFTKAQAFLENIGGASVLFLPCATYNWTPPEGAGQFHGMPLDVKVVHFKGSRKRLMLESWDFLSSSSDIFDMLCLVLSSGRTKYDF
uniref:Nucleotide-diphospho-sugar transferase domain-containing protein n=1 Tax=Salix viminalis TaxID=40686 RepID=A0A6N2MUM6_SALVM